MATRIEGDPTRARKRPKQARSKQLVADILQAAARVFDTDGLAATTNRVAQAAGVSIGSVYQYFPDKHALLLALAERHLDTATQKIQQAIDANQDAADIESFMRALLRALLDEHRAHPHLRPLLRQVGPQSPELAARFEQCAQDAEAAVACFLRRVYPSVENAELRARLVRAAVDGLVHNAGAIDFDEQFEDEAVALCAGYLAR